MSTQPTVLVGTDGSESARAAVRWAAVEAERRNAALTVLHAYDESWGTVDQVRAPGLVEMARNRAETVLADARLDVRALPAHLPVHLAAVPDDPATALVRNAANAALVVVGNRGLGGFRQLALGSVGHRVATHAPCPTVVVRGRPTAADGPVVVGVDGSASSRLALEAAFQAADVRGAPLLAVHAFRPLMPAVLPGLPPEPPVDQERYEAAQYELVTEALAPWRDKFPAVDVRVQAVPGSAAATLVAASQVARLLVVGSRGHGTLVGALLGSVGQQLLHHAECPVMVCRG